MHNILDSADPPHTAHRFPQVNTLSPYKTHRQNEGRAGLQRLVEALGTGGELVVVEATPEAASAARGLSIVSGARGCR